jgi:hypothetical protein
LFFISENSPETLRVDLKKFTLIALANCTFEATSQKSSSRVRKVSSAKIKETFTEFDSSQSGQIDSNSAKEALLKLGIKFSSDIGKYGHEPCCIRLDMTGGQKTDTSITLIFT